MSKEVVRSQFEAMARRLSASGCTEAEAEEVRADQGVELPRSYECFLQLMGRDVGGLFGGTDISCREVLGLRTEAVALLAENHSQFTLPGDAVVFSMHQGYQFTFLRGADGPNPPVWWWTEATAAGDEPARVAESLYEYLESDERSDALPATQMDSHRRSTRAFRRLQFAQEPCPVCAGVMAWRGVIRYERSAENAGRHEMDATCGNCDGHFWRWADTPEEPLRPRS